VEEAALTGGQVQWLRGVRLAHLIESDGPGGAERMLASMVTELQAGGCTNLVVLPVKGEGWLAQQLDGLGVAIEHFQLTQPISPGCARWLEATLRCHAITLAHSHEFAMAVYGAWAARRAGIPHVITMHGGRYYSQRLRRRLALRTAATLSGQLVAVSQELAGHLSRDLWIRPSRVLTIPNGVSYIPAQHSSLRDELQLAPPDRLILSVGNLYPVKGHQHLVEALALLSPRYPRLHVAIAGRGGLADALLARAAALSVSDRLHLLGLRSDIPELLADADVFVLPSLSEGLPMALLEAMFAGCPIVASDVGEVRAVLQGGEAGVLVPPGDGTGLARAIARLLCNPAEARAFGERARQRARAEYDVRVMVTRYARVYERLLRQPQSGTR